MSALPAGFVAPIRRSSDALFRIRLSRRVNVDSDAPKSFAHKFLRTNATAETRIQLGESSSEAHARDVQASFPSVLSPSFFNGFSALMARKSFVKTVTAVNFTSRPLAKEL